jgi:hypothetical protein
MKKLFRKFSVLLLACTMFAGCATICGGHITDCQKTKPTDGTHRKVRVWAVLFNFFPIGQIVDFATGAIYKPCPAK